MTSAIRPFWAAAVTSLSFADIVSNPVLRRELLAGLRSPRARTVLALYLIVPFIVVTLVWPENKLYYGGSSLAEDVWNIFMTTQLWFWVVLVHAISMTREQELGTFEALRLTRITPSEYLMGKWLSSFRTRSAMTACGISTLAIASLIQEASLLALLKNVLSWLLAVEVFGLMVFAVASSCSKTMSAVALSLPLAIALIGASAWILATVFQAKPIIQVFAAHNLLAVGIWFWCYTLSNVESRWNA